MNSPTFSHRRATGFTLMELLVVIAIIIFLAAIILPVVKSVQHRATQVQAGHLMHQLAAAATSYAEQHDHTLPGEGSASQNSWSYAADPANANCWMNALPRILGRKGAGDFARSPEAFYTKDNLLFLPGVPYPEGAARLRRPLYAIGFNSKLERNQTAGTPGVAPDTGPVLLGRITDQSRTVLFLERGLPSEKTALAGLPSYDGAPKARFNAFVARYANRGVLVFVDGHADPNVAPLDILLPDGRAVWSPTDVPRNRAIWCKTPEEDPN